MSTPLFSPMTRIPDLSCLSPDQLASMTPGGWITVADREYSLGESPKSVVKHRQGPPEASIFFWHTAAECDYCDVCLNRLWTRPEFQLAPKLAERAAEAITSSITSSFGIPPVVMNTGDTITAEYTGLHDLMKWSAGGGGGGGELAVEPVLTAGLSPAQLQAFRGQWQEAQKNREPLVGPSGCPAEYPLGEGPRTLPREVEKPKFEPLFPILPAYAPGKYDYYCPGTCVGRCTHKRLTIQEAYDAYHEAYALGYDEALDSMLEYAAEGITGPSGKLRDEISLAEREFDREMEELLNPPPPKQPKPWEVDLSRKSAIGVFVFFAVLVCLLILLL
jgi:hypothetical protein